MHVHILNRTLQKAEELVQTIHQKGGTGSFGEFRPGDWLEDVDLLVQTTPLGLKGEPFPLRLNGVAKKTLAVDIIVNVQETAFLREAKKQGCRVLDGTGMLLYQGALAWEFWLGGKAPLEAMRKGLQDQMLQRMADKN